MHCKMVWLTAIALVLARSVCGQANRPLNSHEVHGDGSITFRYRDTGAKRVEVSVESLKAPLPMANRNGIWSVTTPPLQPETYWYWFIVDGQVQLDPLNDFVLPNYAYLNSNVTVRGPAPELWEPRDVPHGVLSHHFYHSAFANGYPGDVTDYYVYTPPGYGSSRRIYPTLYLLHGYAQTAADWTVPGGANFIMDNLIAQGKVEPMVVVMPLCYGSIEDVSRTIRTEILPRVDAEYRVYKDSDHRAIAGLSLGAMESLDIAFRHPGQFAWLGSFSAGTVGDLLQFAHSLPEGSQSPAFRLIWIGCGIDDSLLAANRELVSALRKRGLLLTSVEIPGGHTWIVWHYDLIHFAPYLFRNKAGRLN